MNTGSAAQQAQAVLEELKQFTGVCHASYQLNPPQISGTTAPIIRTTFPPEWIARYLLRDYLLIDPVVQLGFASASPFFWHEMPVDAKQEAFMKDAAFHGVGEDGFVIPVFAEGRRGILSVTTKLGKADWIACVDEQQYRLRVAAIRVHQLLCRDHATEASPRLLAKRERECLAWVANGLDAQAIAHQLALSSHTVRGYLRAAREKLGCKTLSQAVARAIRMKQIDP